MSTITISKERLDKLEDIESKMQYLESSGVDNWEGYSIALDEYNKHNEKLKKIRNSFDDIMSMLLYSIYDPSDKGAGFAFSEGSEDEAFDLFIKLLKEESK